ncbi:hypothetical protein L292_0785 [Acinetobacter junii CIP 107470 = MTCC 11364]|nr:hypothetical protein L292_0785 [Acinetobacter junii CIP 107470 = MTCC 11364]
MLCNGLFFAYALFDENNSDSFNANNTMHVASESASKNNYIN